MSRVEVLRWLLVPSLYGLDQLTAASTVEHGSPAEKARIKAFWSDNPNLSTTSSAPRESLDYFREVDAHRQDTHWQLYEIVPFADSPGQRVLEIGCGLGTDGAEFARRGGRYVGIDLTWPAVRLTKRKLEAYKLSGATAQADAEQLPFADDSFDLVYSWGVIHHTPDTQRSVNEIYRVLRPGGQVILMLYYAWGWWELRIRLHWFLLSLLRLPPVAALAHRVFGARSGDIARWNALYKRDRRALYRQFLARETDTPSGMGDVNPHSKVYDKGDARRLLAAFEHIHTQAAHWLDLPSLEPLLGCRLYRKFIRGVGAVNGSCLYVFARKPAV